jgi:hypothetical protein
MLDKTNNEHFYKRAEKHADKSAQIEFANAIKVGGRLVFDLLNGQITVIESAFKDDAAFVAGANVIPQSEKRIVLSDEATAAFFTQHKNILNYFRELFTTADAEEKERERVAAQTGKEDRKRRFDAAKAEIERAGGRVILPDEPTNGAVSGTTPKTSETKGK